MFAIAENLGGCTVDELSNRMSVGEMLEWRKYFELKEEQRKKARKEAKNKTPRR